MQKTPQQAKRRMQKALRSLESAHAQFVAPTGLHGEAFYAHSDKTLERLNAAKVRRRSAEQALKKHKAELAAQRVTPQEAKRRVLAAQGKVMAIDASISKVYKRVDQLIKENPNLLPKKGATVSILDRNLPKTLETVALWWEIYFMGKRFDRLSRAKEALETAQAVYHRVAKGPIRKRYQHRHSSKQKKRV